MDIFICVLYFFMDILFACYIFLDALYYIFLFKIIYIMNFNYFATYASLAYLGFPNEK